MYLSGDLHHETPASGFRSALASRIEAKRPTCGGTLVTRALRSQGLWLTLTYLFLLLLLTRPYV